MSAIPNPINLTDRRNRPFSLISVSSNSPHITTGSHNRTNSLTTKIFGRSTSHESSLTSPRPDRSSARYDPSYFEDDIEKPENDQCDSMSETSGHPDSSTVGKKPPPTPHSDRSQSYRSQSRKISVPLTASPSLFTFRKGTPEMSSTLGLKSPNVSRAGTPDTFESDEGISEYRVWGFPFRKSAKRERHPRALACATEDDRAIRMNVETSKEDSQKDLADSGVASESLYEEPSTEPRPDKGFRLPPLPKFFKPTSPGLAKRENLEAEKEDHYSSRGQEREAHPGSLFEAPSSDEDEAAAVIANAEQATFRRPVVVRHTGSLKLGIKEMLNSTPPIDNSVPTRTRATRILGDDIDPKELQANRRSGVIGMPLPEQQERPEQTLAEDSVGVVSSNFWKNTINPFATNVLRSSPEVPGLSRKVSFPPPLKIDIQPEHRFLRQSVISTPYPLGHEGKRKSAATSDLENGTITGRTWALTLVLYSHGNPVPRVNKLIIPKPQQTELADSSDERKSPTKANLKPNFDDERLFKLIRKEYTKMRGCFGKLFSARGVRSIKIISYSSSSQPASRHRKIMHFRTADADVDFAEVRLGDLYQIPRLGRNDHEWLDWIARLPENCGQEGGGVEKIALELVEGWCVGRLGFGVFVCVLCSVVATLLWILLGVGGTEVQVGDVRSGDGSGDAARVGLVDILSHGAGGRVVGGFAFGVLVLLLGWTGIVAWVLLSWLVM